MSTHNTPPAADNKESVPVVSDLSQLVIEGTDDVRRRAAWSWALDQAQASLGKKLGRPLTDADAELVSAERNSIYIRGFMVPAIMQNVKKQIGVSTGKALGQSVEDAEKIQKAVADGLKETLTNALTRISTNETEATNDWRRNYQSTQKNVVDQAIAIRMSPYQAQATLANLGTLFGGLSMMIGQATNSPKLVEWGVNAMQTSELMAKQAGKEALDLQELAKQLKRAPDGFDERNMASRSNFVAEGVSLVNGIPTIMTADIIKRMTAQADGEDLIYPGLAQSNPAGSNRPGRVAFTPIQEREIATVFDAMIKRESNGQQFDRNGQPLESVIRDKKTGERLPGAIGRAQVMPGTAPLAAKLAGLPFDPVKYRNDANYNTALGLAYFRQQVADFGDMNLAVMAYNAGPGAVNDFMNGTNKAGSNRAGLRIGDPRKGDVLMSDFVAKFPYAETRDYVSFVSARVASGRGQDLAANSGVAVPSSMVQPTGARTGAAAPGSTPKDTAKPQKDAKLEVIELPSGTKLELGIAADGLSVRPPFHAATHAPKPSGGGGELGHNKAEIHVASAEELTNKDKGPGVRQSPLAIFMPAPQPNFFT